MRNRLAAVSLALALGIGGVAVAPGAGAATVHSTPRPVAVAAPGFYAGGTWELYQSNGFTVTLNLTQDGGGHLYGSGYYGGTSGTVEYGAVVDGTSIYFTIGWSNGARGRYTGSLGSDRRLSGLTYDLNNPSSQASWSTTRVFY
ncbi:hypothetical protein Q3V23_29180 [Streptomyces sp. VNUA116]|uniref:hypothetical protein n=1 Tax=Streptomyces sp. VNUA116 TaxID=3062449 RepID=UPI002675D1E3|nr:hypothetical protein [Streptomyces sp. VNUA116]WKU47796.1 hypothetical protein Q3V23_29180 [Streptomyces sp. VNUA116]